MFGKIVDGIIRFAPTTVVLKNRVIANPNSDQIKELGYLPIQTAEPPEAQEGYYTKDEYEEVDGQIIQKWIMEKIQEIVEEDPLERFYKILRGDIR